MKHDMKPIVDLMDESINKLNKPEKMDKADKYIEYLTSRLDFIIDDKEKVDKVLTLISGEVLDSIGNTEEELELEERTLEQMFWLQVERKLYKK